ncbi:hypothetical protein D3C81_112990 [compost metagenome]|uniref:YoaK family protein n=1 Tax=Janthinobacterium sp. AD80 TaxID=1528773 RepID=UPI000C83F362|nr:YoaK family protein [Janthinobacterium sp. AD80]PMQ14976.1 hypothetical protein JaAD80_18130 [Janthinobacterium sp. AD80]
MNQPPHSRLFGASLGFLAGYVDTLGFIALFGLFTAHVTGNFVLIGAALADPSRVSILLKFLAFPAFVIGVAVTRLMVLAIDRRGGPSLTLALLLQWVLLAAFMAFGCLAEPIGKDVSDMAMIAGLLGTAAMGVHSATSRLLLAHLAPTSMMTGNVTQIVLDTVDVLRGAADASTSARCVKTLWPLLAFALGAIAAAFAYLAYGFIALAVPLLVLGAVIVVQQRSARAAVPVA